LILIPAMPLAAALVTAALGRPVLGVRSHWPTVGAVAISCVASILLVFAVQRDAPHETIVPLWTWAVVDDAYRVPQGTGEGTAVRDPAASPEASGSRQVDHDARHGAWRDLRLDLTLRADPLTAIMLAMVTFISLVVVVYSIGYMNADPGYWRFFAYVALFIFSMTMLVSVSNFVFLYVFWEAVGLCSYLLIGFWFQKREAAAAGLKAFLVNRIGDFGFALGVFLLWTTFGTLDFHDVKLAPAALPEHVAGASETAAPRHETKAIHDPAAVEDPAVVGRVVPGILGREMSKNPDLFIGGGVATAICLLLLSGACGKSAQFPLHVWLPDAMEGPTPVSALIHAATMVTAGVYLVARCTPLFAASPDAQQVVAVIGGGTALMAAVIALTQTDLKRMLAYSTISQLGFMFLALGVGSFVGVAAAMFHLVAHAFFKALLFLGAGSVMHAMGGVIDIRQFGGLRHRLPTTHWTFLFGCLALAGIVPFAGFWSKDAILGAVLEKADAGDAELYSLLYGVAVLTAFLTALYSFRAFFLTFYGEERLPREAGRHAHESPPVMTGPLVILALGALGVGTYFQWTGDFLSPGGFLAGTSSLTCVRTAETGAPTVSHLSVALAGTLAAVAGVALAAWFYVPRRRTAVEAVASLMRGLGLYGLSHGKFFIDPIYAVLVVGPLEAFSRLCAWIDRHVIDGLVDALGRLPGALGLVLRPLQSGMIQFYALVMMLGVLALIGVLLL
jgi:NADH-quinone oxidoreductase subunit L